MTNAPNKTYKLDELATAAGVSPRTVRYYVQRGLLPGPAFKGKDTAYSAEHLVRLKAIKALQDRFLPLDVIQIELARRSLAELERVHEWAAPPKDEIKADQEPIVLKGPYRSPARPAPAAAIGT